MAIPRLSYTVVAGYDAVKPVALGYLDLRNRMGGEAQGEKRLTWVCESAGKERGHSSH